MTDHPKPIARYWATIKAPKAENGFDLKNYTTVVLEADHEAALAAEREQYEARIAELENFGANLASEKFGLGVQLDDLRTAIEAIANDWHQEYLNWHMPGAHEDETGEDDTGNAYAGTCRIHAARLRALLEKKP